MNGLLNKFKEVLIAVTPIVVFVLILTFTVSPVPGVMLAGFIIGAALIIAGLSLLLLGVDLAFLPLGNNMGKTLLTSNKLWFVIIISLVLGFFITLAEPSVKVLADQVAYVTSDAVPALLTRILIASGAGALLSLGMVRIVESFSLRIIMSAILFSALVLSFFASPDMFAVAFDAVGAATGAVTVPFILALALGASAMKRNSKTAGEDSFGLVGTTALGAVFGVLILGLFSNSVSSPGELTEIAELTETINITEKSLLSSFTAEMPGVAAEAFFSLLPVIIILIIFQKFSFKLQKRAFRKILAGFLYSYAGLFLFFVGVKAGFLEVGKLIGGGLADFGNNPLLVGTGFVLGMLIVLTEPAVYVFTHQIEDITNGHIKRKTVLIFLAVGVAFSVGLSMLRIIVPGIMLWHYLLPGFGSAAVLMFITPKLFAGIGFDSGAVAAGPMTATFVLAFTQGVSEAVEYSDVLIDSFGVIAMVTMTPVIALQILGIVYKFKLERNKSKEIGGVD